MHDAVRTDAGVMNPDVRFEPDRVYVRGVFVFVAVLAISLVLVGFVQRGIFNILERREASIKPPPGPLASSEDPRLPPGPRLEVSPRQRLAEMRKREDALLQSYGWVDRKAGTVRIPIDRAIDILAKKGVLK